MGYPHRDPWYVPTSYPLDESRCCTYKGYDVRTQQGSRGWYSIQGVPGDADAVWGTVCPGQGAGCPRKIPFFFQGRCRRRETRSACARHACFLRTGQQPVQHKTGGMSARHLHSYKHCMLDMWKQTLCLFVDRDEDS